MTRASFPMRWLAGLGLLLLLGTIPASLQAQGVSWAVAQRDDARILGLVEKLVPYVDDLEGVEESGGVILYHQWNARVEDRKAELCRNLILRLDRPLDPTEPLLQPVVERGQEMQSQAAFLLRDGVVTRLPEAELSGGEPEISRTRLLLEWPEIQPGDVLGWSLVTRWEEPLMALHFPAADRFPVVIANLKIQTDGKAAYRLFGEGVEDGGFELKEEQLQNSRPTLWKATMRALAPQEPAFTEPPYGPDFPHISAYMAETWFELEDFPAPPGWMSMTGWNMGAGMLEGFLEQTSKDVRGLDITLAALTAGLSTDEEKERALFTFVHDQIQSLEGEEYSRRGLRPLDEVLKDRRATETEKALLLATMLRESGVEVHLAALRDGRRGGIREDFPTVLQFSDLIVRTGGASPRFYAPQCADCGPGELPAAWQEGPIFSAVDGYLDLAKAFNDEVRKKAMTEGSFDILTVQKETEEKDWHRFESFQAP